MQHAAGDVARFLDPHAVRQRRGGITQGGVALQCARHRIHAFDLRADHLHALRLQCQHDAGGQATTADRHQHHIGHQRGQFQPDRALPGDDVGIVERRQQAVAVLRGEFGGEGLGLVVGLAVQAHRGAPMGDTGDLGVRRGLRHHRDRRHAQAIRGPGQALCVVAGGRGDGRAGIAAFARGQQRVHRAAHLVRAGALQVLQLQPAAEALGVVQWRGIEVTTQPRLRRQHVAGGHLHGAGYRIVHQTAVSQWRWSASSPRTTRW